LRDGGEVGLRVEVEKGSQGGEVGVCDGEGEAEAADENELAKRAVMEGLRGFGEVADGGMVDIWRVWDMKWVWEWV
jgi:hypothetical protein